jgi:nucleoside-diphosphate-sugar epimerase
MLVDYGYSVIPCVRKLYEHIPLHYQTVEVKDVASFNNWVFHLQGCDTIIHLAARAHILENSSNNSIYEFRRVNRDATLRLAEAAVATSVKRFVYVSSIGVHGVSSTIDGSFDNKSPYNPQVPYAISKMEAEIGLEKISDSTDMKIVIVRPPIVFGPVVPGNFHRLLNLVDLGLPLPFGSMRSMKSMISLENISDLLMKCVSASLPHFSKFVISDGSNWSTADLVHLIPEKMEKKIALLPMPVSILEKMAFLVGKSDEIRKLSLPLVVDGSETAKILDWEPTQASGDGVKEAVDYYRAHKEQGR